MKSLVVKRSAAIAGHKTSVSLEDAFWEVVKEIAFERDITLSDLIGKIDSERQPGNPSSAIRLNFIAIKFQSIGSGSEREKCWARGNCDCPKTGATNQPLARVEPWRSRDDDAPFVALLG